MENKPSNSDKEQTVAAIALGPMGNLKGSYKYFALITKKKIVHPQDTPLSMPDSVIELVEKIARQQNTPENIRFTTNCGKKSKLRTNMRILDLWMLMIDESDFFSHW